jgi:PAS domain S-box-containing protein
VNALQRLLGDLYASARRRISSATPAIEVLAALISDLPCAAVVADSSGRFVAVNDRAVALTGYSRVEMLRSSVWQITPATDEHDAERLWRAFLVAGTQTGRYSVLTKDRRSIEADYAARAHVLPGLYLSLLEAARGR